MRNKIALKGLLIAGLAAVTITGCGKAGTFTTGTEAAAQKQEDVIEAQSSADIKGAEVPEHMVVTKTSAVGDSLMGGSTLMVGNDVNDQEIINKSVQALKTYLDISVNESQYEISVTYFEAVDEKDEASYLVFFEAPVNRQFLQGECFGADGFPLPEVLKNLTQEYSLTFSVSKELTSLQTLYAQQGTNTPLSIEEVKTMAKDFLLTHKLTAESNLKFMGSGYGSNIAMAIFENGKNGAVQVEINPRSGKIVGFSYMTRERAELLLNPVKEGFGVG